MKEVIETGSGTCEGCKNCGMGCTCGRMHGYSGHPVLRILLALAIVGFVFAAGVKLGELKAELGMGYEGGYQHHMMMGRAEGFQLYQDQGMMQPADTTLVVPATGATPAKTTTTTTVTAPAAR